MSILSKILAGNTIYYPGCLTKFVAIDLQAKNEKLLRKIGIDFISLSELELCCGSPALKAGYPEDFHHLAKQNHKLLTDHGVTRIITNCPACFMIFTKNYSEVLGSVWKIKVNHTSQVFYQTFIEKKIKLNPRHGRVTYHDPCHLGRQMGVYNEPRELIKGCGYDLLEMPYSRRDSRCCGGGGGVYSNEPELANRISQSRIDQAASTKAEILCTACSLCYLHLRQNSLTSKNKIKVMELTELLEDSINYERIE